MRVIAGSAKRILLSAPSGFGTRPTTDRIKETLFNMIGTKLADCRFLDLFAGSGAIGIEALSRGAEQAVFVEREQEALQCIKHNLLRTKLDSRATVLKMDAAAAIRQLAAEQKVFDIIFMDPPYRAKEAEKILELLSGKTICREDTIIIIEEARETDFSFAAGLGFEVQKEKIYGTSKHVFLAVTLNA